MSQDDRARAGEPYTYSGLNWGDESGFAKWMRENPDEVREVDEAITRKLGDDMRTAEEFLSVHPTPWRVEDIKSRGELHEAIVDANGDVVLSSKDAESYQSVFAPDNAAEALVKFVNAASDAYIR